MGNFNELKCFVFLKTNKREKGKENMSTLEYAKKLAETFIGMSKSNNDDEVAGICDQIVSSCSSETKPVFSSTTFVQEIIVALNTTRKANTIFKICHVIGLICVNNPEGAKLFSTPEVRDTIVACFKYANTDYSAAFVCYAIWNICCNPDGQKLFSTAEVRDAILSLFQYATTANGVFQAYYAVLFICSENPEGQKLFSTAASRNAILGLLKHATDKASKDAFDDCIATICNGDAKAFEAFKNPSAVFPPVTKTDVKSTATEQAEEEAAVKKKADEEA
jgi:hypothetical protein